jgi:cytochrome c553
MFNGGESHGTAGGSGGRDGNASELKTARLVSVTLGAALCLGAAATFAGGDAEHGNSLFQTYCAGCHGPDGRGGAHTFMPHVDS